MCARINYESHSAVAHYVPTVRVQIGVVGRTGAGKSSLFQALFRVVELVSGAVYLDGIDVSQVSLKELRCA